MTTATALAVAFVVYSCKSNLSEAEKLNLKEIPLQTVDSMFFVQTENGRLKMRVQAGRMESYDRDSFSFDLFPAGLAIFAYAEDGTLETTITSREARHDKYPGVDREKWAAYGNVVIRNVAKNETMETDTIYWDRIKQEIWTDCYIKMYSPSGMMQGYGMRSDERARNAILMQPFDNDFYFGEDSTYVVVDSVNFIGPMPKKGYILK